MQNFWHCFIPIFAAVDAIGVLPFFVSLTMGLSNKKLNKIIIQSVLTAALAGLFFIFFGKIILGFMGITFGDFMIGGGLLLLIISINDILSYEKRKRNGEATDLGAVPIGVPLIVGPAVLTTSMLLLGQYGLGNVIGAMFLNIIIAGILFSFSRPIYKLFGQPGSRAISKLASIILAALSVMIMRKGIFFIIQSLK